MSSEVKLPQPPPPENRDRDFVFVAGLLMFGLGCGWAWPPAGLIGPGVILMALAVRGGAHVQRSPRGKRG